MPVSVGMRRRGGPSPIARAVNGFLSTLNIVIQKLSKVKALAGVKVLELLAMTLRLFGLDRSQKGLNVGVGADYKLMGEKYYQHAILIKNLI